MRGQVSIIIEGGQNSGISKKQIKRILQTKQIISKNQNGTESAWSAWSAFSFIKKADQGKYERLYFFNEKADQVITVADDEQIPGISGLIGLIKKMILSQTLQNLNPPKKLGNRLQYLWSNHILSKFLCLTTNQPTNC